MRAPAGEMATAAPQPSRSDLRAVPQLWPHRQRRNVVIACLDDPAEYESARPALSALDAELIVERRPGALSGLLGRPSVTVCDRFLDVRLQAERPTLAAVLDELHLIEYSCPECPQAADEGR